MIHSDFFLEIVQLMRSGCSKKVACSICRKMNLVGGFIMVCLFEAVSAAILPCSSGINCGSNQYCHGSRCMDCIICSYISRVNLTACPRSLYECGRCQTGYHETPLNGVPSDHVKACEIDVDNYKDSCSNDILCPEGQFCSERKCKLCLDCNSHHMHPSTFCAKTTDDCGLCLTGYLDLVAKDAFQTRSCVGPSASLLGQNTEVQINVNAMSTVGVFVIVGFSVIVVIFIYRARKHRSDGVNISETPPPYTASIGNNATSEEVVEQAVMCTSYKESGDVANTARVFRLPNYCDPPSPSAITVTNPTSDDAREESIICDCYKESGEVDNTARMVRLPNYTDPPSVTYKFDSIEAHNEETLPCSRRPHNEEGIAHLGSITFVGRLAEATEPHSTSSAFSGQPAPKRQKTSD